MQDWVDIVGLVLVKPCRLHTEVVYPSEDATNDAATTLNGEHKRWEASICTRYIVRRPPAGRTRTAVVTGSVLLHTSIHSFIQSFTERSLVVTSYKQGIERRNDMCSALMVQIVHDSTIPTIKNTHVVTAPRPSFAWAAPPTEIFFRYLCEIMQFCALSHKNIKIGKLCLGELTFSFFEEGEGAKAPPQTGPKPMPGYVPVHEWSCPRRSYILSSTEIHSRGSEPQGSKIVLLRKFHDSSFLVASSSDTSETPRSNSSWLVSERGSNDENCFRGISALVAYITAETIASKYIAVNAIEWTDLAWCWTWLDWPRPLTAPAAGQDHVASRPCRRS